MSRLDLIKEFKNENGETFNKCSRAYEMGRADAIEECIELVSDNTCMYGCTEDDCIPCTIEKMEQLKEQYK